MNPIALIRTYIRAFVTQIARLLNNVTGGRLTPDMVTWVGFLAHFAVAYYIVAGDLVIAAVLLVVFGLFDTLDGSLARLQKVDRPRGMFIDATTDRFKEVIIFTAMAAYLLDKSYIGVILCTLACGIALSISYIRAKGESALVAAGQLSARDINKVFKDGIGAFEIRVTLLAIGLAANQLPVFVGLVVVLGSMTLVERFTRVYRAL